MLVCARCGQENPPDARFCNACAAPLAGDGAERREERKVVSVVFADLVDFTARAESLDPEDLRALLASYHRRLREELERAGGTVEKFIGDAVMGLFGAPIAHEDDPERAVRAALAIRDWIADESDDLQLRIAVDTGEALVSLEARVSEGEGMAAGDVVNTASRLQDAAPVNGVLVGDSTYLATRHAIDYEPHEPVVAKGRSAPLPAWLAIRARSRAQVERLGGAPLVGREDELTLLRNTFDRARHSREPQLVTLVGVPGIGKSRLVYELFDLIESAPELVFWRRGRSLPYGDGVTFWALGEVVKAQAGILESDRTEEVERKLDQAVADLFAGDPNGAWVVGHLRPLVGLGSEEPVESGSHDDAYAAWCRFIEALAERRPLVLAFEDLHWADDAMLEFLDELVDWASDIPLLVLCTARPELLARRSGWGGGKPNALTLSLAPLSEADSARLADGLLGETTVPEETRSALLDRAAGNPLYTEELVRLTQERGPLGDEPADLPESIQGIIAARLDALDRPDKGILQDAAVLGRVFWVGALSSVSGIEWPEVEERLRALERKQFVRRVRNSSVADESEYVFGHVLVRDVAYGQLPRAARAERHRRAAEWLEGLGRAEDHAEMLAHHYLEVLELSGDDATGDPALIQRARPALRAAGHRAMALAAYGAANRFYGAALRLCPEDDAERAHLLLRHGLALRATEGQGLEVLTEALERFRESGDNEAAAEAATAIGQMLWLRGQRDEAYEYADEAVALVRDAPPSRAKAIALLTRAGLHNVTGEFPQTQRLAREALVSIDELGLEERRPRALSLIGWGRIGAGDVAGLAEMEEAVSASLKPPFEYVHSSFENLRSAQFSLGRLADASATVEQHVESRDRLGIEWRRWLDVLRAGDAFVRGRWDESLEIANDFLAVVEAGTPHYLEPPCRTLRAAIELGRDDLVGAAADAERSLDAGRQSKDRQVLSHAVVGAAIVALAEGRTDQALELATEFEGLLPEQFVFALTFGWPTLAGVAWLMRDLGLGEELRRMIEAIPVATPWCEAGRAIEAQDDVGAAEILEAIGYPSGAADARLRAAEAASQARDAVAAKAEAERALEFYRRVGATRYIRQAEAFLEPERSTT